MADPLGLRGERDLSGGLAPAGSDGAMADREIRPSGGIGRNQAAPIFRTLG